ncbi:ATP-dependent DNA helicase DinG [Arsukibacterium sp.]|uniref:ATP-dependent DNA helicase DinG n=1 Tax=Arsukibacterium sp. TaxID=1977258 RepID=UPI002FDB162E
MSSTVNLYRFFMLNDALKTQIRQLQQAIKQTLPNYHARPGQNRLIAEMAKVVAGDYHRHQRIALIEAGTGTGKSLAYLLGCLPYALSKQKTLIIATATVALQEQLVNKDLPFFRQATGLAFEFSLVKGRQRYACMQRLQQRLKQPELFSFAASHDESVLLQRLLKAWQQRSWLGDRDSLPETVPDALWQLISAAPHQCPKHDHRHKHCPFQLARAELDNSQVLVVNHSLLLADLANGNAVLPEPEACIYVIDEAHHLPDCGRDYFAAEAQLTDNTLWLEKLRKTLQQLHSNLPDSALATLLKLDDACSDFAAALKPIERSLSDYLPVWFAQDNSTEYRFSHAALPSLWQTQSEPLQQSSQQALNFLDKVIPILQEAINEGRIAAKHSIALLQELVFYQQKFSQQSGLWQSYAQRQSEPAWQARWVSRQQQQLSAHACPLGVGQQLQQLLFSPAFACILCSATLTALNSFTPIQRELGLNDSEGLQCLQVSSPFDYAKHAQLILPAMNTEPTDAGFTEELIKVLPSYLPKEQASLVLFASYWQMQQVAKAIREQGYSLLVQGEASRQALLQLHQTQCEHGHTSILFGTQSFSEGLDLPGKLLTNLIITKLPFAVPTSPLEQALSEAISARGGNPFLQLTVPVTARKLVQACGRLLRQEQDKGRVIIFDQRLRTKAYGKAMLDSLPPFQRLSQLDIAVISTEE